MWEFQKLLLEDIRTARDYGKEQPSHFALRTIIRTSAAYIEGTVYQLRLVCLAANEDCPHLFSNEEIIALKEKTVVLDKKGKVKLKDSYQKIQQSIIFTFSSFAKLHGVDFKPDTSNHRWESLGAFFKIRNLLMHPKQLSDFIITEETNRKSIEAVSWFQENLKSLYRKCEAAEAESK